MNLYVLPFLILVRNTFGSLVYPEWGTFLHDMPDSELLFITAEGQAVLQLGFHAPKIQFLNGSSNPNCASLYKKLSSQGNLEILGRKFFLHKFYEYIRKDFDINERDQIFEILIDKNALNETLRPLVDNQVLNFEPVKVEETTVSSSLVTPYSSNVSLTTPEMKNEETDSLHIDIGAVRDKLELEKISSISAKFSNESPLLAFDKNESTYFTFKAFPVSGNGKLYRSLRFRTKFSIKYLILLLADSFSADFSDQYDVVVRQNEGSGRQSASRLCKFKNVTLSEAGQQKVYYGCHSTILETEYTINFRFENQSEVEAAEIFEIYFEERPEKGSELLGRSKRQFGEIVGAVALGTLMGTGLNSYFSENSNSASSESHANAEITKNFKILVDSERKNFETLTEEICSNENYSEQKIFQEYLSKEFEHFVDEFEFTLLSSNLNLKENKIQKILVDICRDLNPRVPTRACEAYYRLKGKFRFYELSVSKPSEIEDDNVALHLSLKILQPVLSLTTQTVSEIFSVPMYINGTDPYQFKQIVNLPQYISKTTGGTYMSLDTCSRYDEHFFCNTRSLTKVLSKNDCLNTFIDQKDLNCEISHFNSSNDCFFRLVNSTFLLESSIGSAIFVHDVPPGPINQKWVPTQKRVLENFEILHNIEDFRIMCNQSSYRGSLVEHNMTVDILDPIPIVVSVLGNQPVKNFSEPVLVTVTNKIKTKDSGSPFFNWLHGLGWWQAPLTWVGIVIGSFFMLVAVIACTILTAKTIFRKILAAKDFSLPRFEAPKKRTNGHQVGSENPGYLPGLDYEKSLV